MKMPKCTYLCPLCNEYSFASVYILVLLKGEKTSLCIKCANRYRTFEQDKYEVNEKYKEIKEKNISNKV